MEARRRALSEPPSEGQRRALSEPLFPLTTPRLLLRPFEPGDLDAVHAFSSDPEVCRHVAWGPNTLDDSRAFLADALREVTDPDRTHWSCAVVLRATGAVVGSCAVWVTSAEHGRGELGYALAREHWGRGYATEAASALVALALGPLGLERVEATCRPENTASRRVLEKAGLVLEGRLRGHVVVRGERRDSLLLAATAGARAVATASDWAREPGHGRYARTERERRFLVRGPAPLGAAERLVEDRYLDGLRLRLRRVSGQGRTVHKLTQKVRTREGDPSEVRLTGTYLSAEEHALLATLPGRDLVKTRSVVTTGAHDVVVDVFRGPLEGLVLAEVEVEDLRARVDLPAWVGEEVTSDDRFSGGRLSRTDAAGLAELLGGP